jgi:hypothetical protein
MMFDQVTAPLIGRDAIARRGQDEIVFVVLIGPQGAAFGAEGARAAGYGRGPFRYGELRSASMATSIYAHRVCSPWIAGVTQAAMSALRLGFRCGSNQSQVRRSQRL